MFQTILEKLLPARPNNIMFETTLGIMFRSVYIMYELDHDSFSIAKVLGNTSLMSKLVIR